MTSIIERLNEKLKNLKPEQINVFKRMYESVDCIIGIDKLQWVEVQIDNTIKKNIKEEQKEILIEISKL